MEEYISKAKVTTLSATSRASIKAPDGNFYTVEYHEERLIPDTDDINLEQERSILWDLVNSECDKQAEDIFIYKK